MDITWPIRIKFNVFGGKKDSVGYVIRLMILPQIFKYLAMVIRNLRKLVVAHMGLMVRGDFTPKVWAIKKGPLSKIGH